MVTLSSARRASHSDTMAAFARLGLAARAIIYLVIGALAVEIALGHRGQEADQRGALAAIAQHRFGIVLLWTLGVGFASYALWRLSEAVFGTSAYGDKVGPRAQSLARGVIYAAFAVSTFAFISGTSQQGQAQQQETLTARVMKDQPGRWLVGVAGLVVVAVGAAMVIEGVTRKFDKQLELGDTQPAIRKIVISLGAIGTTARGIVFAVVGALVIDAAVTYNPTKSSGLDGALRTLADRPYGPWLLGILAIGLIIFGIYGLAAARWTKI